MRLTPKGLLIAGLVLVVSAVAASLLFTQQSQSVIIQGTAVPPVPTSNVTLVKEGEMLYNQYCVECHATDLAGAPDWKLPLPDGNLPPPPHDGSGHTWHHSDNQLIEITLKGGAELYDGTMPGFENQLSLGQVQTILDYIKSHWDQEQLEYQWWLTANESTP